MLLSPLLQEVPTGSSWTSECFVRQIGLSERIGDFERLHSAAEYAADATNLYGLRPALFQGCVVCIKYFSKGQEALDCLWYATKVPMMEMFDGLVELSSVYEVTRRRGVFAWIDFLDEYIDVLRELVDSKIDRIGEYLLQHLCLRKGESMGPILADIDGIVAPDLPESTIDHSGPMEWRTEKCTESAAIVLEPELLSTAKPTEKSRNLHPDLIGINFEFVEECQPQTAVLIDFNSAGIPLDVSDTLLNSHDCEVHPDLIGINFESVVECQPQTAVLLDFDSKGVPLDDSDTLLNSHDCEVHPDLIQLNFDLVINKKCTILDLPPPQLQSKCFAEDLSFLEPPPAFVDSGVPLAPLLFVCARDPLLLERLSPNEGNTVNSSGRSGNNLLGNDYGDIADFAKPAKTGLSGEIARRYQRLPPPYLVMTTIGEICWVVFCLTFFLVLSRINFGIPLPANVDLEISFPK